MSRGGGTRAGGWATRTFSIFLHTEQQETSRSLRLTPDAQGTAVLCVAVLPGVPAGCAAAGARAGAALPAGHGGAAHRPQRSAVRETRRAGAAAFCSLPLAQTPSPRLTAMLCVCMFCLVLCRVFFFGCFSFFFFF